MNSVKMVFTSLFSVFLFYFGRKEDSESFFEISYGCKISYNVISYKQNIGYCMNTSKIVTFTTSFSVSTVLWKICVCITTFFFLFYVSSIVPSAARNRTFLLRYGRWNWSGPTRVLQCPDSLRPYFFGIQLESI